MATYVDLEPVHHALQDAMATYRTFISSRRLSDPTTEAEWGLLCDRIRKLGAEYVSALDKYQPG